MAAVLVTGGTGVLGTYLADRLASRGHEVRALSRRAPQSMHPKVSYLRGNVLTGDGLDDAVTGVDTVIHAATSFRRRARETELRGTENTLAAAKSADAHFIYMSIVGTDRNSLGYYKAKLEAERIVEASGSNWTIQRATQFHELIDTFLGLPVFPVTRNMSFQCVDAGDVSERLVQLVDNGPTGRAEDFGGPEVVPIRELAAARTRIAGRKSRLVPMPVKGFFEDFDRGAHLCPDQARGTRTWQQWLQDHS